MNELTKIKTNALYPIGSEEITKRVDSALVAISEMNQVFKIWNRSHSDFCNSLMVLDHVCDTRNLRQLSAEIKAKRDALVEVHFAYKENLLKAQIHERNAESLEGLDRDLELLYADKERAYAQMKHEGVVGATKDIEGLRLSYDKILARIIEKHGKFDEEVFEAEETEYWIKRFFIQAMRDIRECGRIRTGAQRDLEQLGIDPSMAQGLMGDFLSHQENITNPEAKDNFLQAMVKKFSEQVITRKEKT